eukprot:CAMPEP_0175637278 /NCGR_PEP_ID=MMETSP0097-20121207/2634_1 /TAXON_ID=311494 /ORGANISM="Alexandrium monilatum, Strain CCMP3105" /LENGTH=926 /DNA_ID=CAMNT_0016942961 /DNA_START=18 /DNA_END=2794 /DNA_ORIENTATION=+
MAAPTVAAQHGLHLAQRFCAGHPAARCPPCGVSPPTTPARQAAVAGAHVGPAFDELSSAVFLRAAAVPSDRGLSGILKAAVKLQRARPGLQVLVRQCIEDFLGLTCRPRPRDLSIAAWALAKFGLPVPGALLERAAATLPDFDPPELTKLAWVCAKLDVGDAVLMHDLSRAVVSKLYMFNALGLSNIAWAFASHGALARSQRCNRALFDALANQVTAQAPHFAPQGLSNVAWAFAKQDHSDPALLRTLSRQAVPKLQNFRPQELCNLAWAFASLVAHEPSLFEGLAVAAPAGLQGCAPQGLANLAWALAAVGVPRPELFRRIAVQSMMKARHFKPAELSSLLWAFAKLSAVELELLRTVARKSVAQRAVLSAWSLSNLLWSLATMAATVPELVGEVPELTSMVTKELTAKVSALAPQGVSNAAWAASKLGVVDPTLFRSLASETILQLEAIGPQQLSNLAWAFASASVDDAHLFSLLARAVHAELHGFKPQGLANVAWAFATVGISKPDLLQAIARRASLSVCTFKPQELANLLWAFATLSAHDQELFRSSIDAAIPRLAVFEPQHLSNVAWACATMRVERGDLFEALAKEAIPRLREFSPQDTTNLLWAVRILDLHELELLQAIAGELVSSLSQARETSEAPQLVPALAPVLETVRPVDAHPMVLLDLPDRAVVGKPVGWEVDQSPDGSRGGVGGAHQLSRYVQGVWSVRSWPIFASGDRDQGFLHRLDVPTSGLILVAKTPDAYRDLEVQLGAGTLLRDYRVLMHGWVPVARGSLDAPLRWDEGGAGPTRVCSRGKPSVTRLKVLAHAVNAAFGGAVFSLAAMRIDTGRRHQIRAHASHVGHPIAVDGKYSARPTFVRDYGWCRRNFLHRCRLSFVDCKGLRRDVFAPLPADLVMALDALLPRQATSAAVISRWGGDTHRSARR